VFKRRTELFASQAVTFLDSGESSSLTGTPFPSSGIYDSANKASYFEQAFVIEQKIGEGCFGTVYKVRSREDGKHYAVKIARERYKRDPPRVL
jgi:serine/threonine protein kinase